MITVELAPHTVTTAKPSVRSLRFIDGPGDYGAPAGTAGQPTRGYWITMLNRRRLGAGIVVRVRHVGLEADRIPASKQMLLIGDADLELSRMQGDELLRTGDVRLGVQVAARVELDRVRLEATLGVERKGGVVAYPPSSSTNGSTSLRATISESSCARVTSDVNEIFRPLAIRQSVEIVGFTSPRSICPSMLLLTPDSFATASRLKPFSARRRLRFSLMSWLRWSTVVSPRFLCTILHEP